MTETLRLFAAGSLADVLLGFRPSAGLGVATLFGPSGLLRAQIEDGAPWDVFISADEGHPARLHQTGLGTAPRVFCHNALSLILRPGLPVDAPETLLKRTDLRLGISTPGNDPSGDYAVAALERLEAGLSSRALRLTGAPGLPQAPDGRNTYAWLIESGAADMFLTYRTNARAAMADSPRLKAVDLPDAIQVTATYSLTTRVGAGLDAQTLANALLAAEFQSRLTDYGFTPATKTLPEGVCT